MLSTESTFELEVCVTFMKVFRCNTLFLLCQYFAKMMCQNVREPYLFLSYVFCKKHLPLYRSVHFAGARGPHHLQSKNEYGIRPDLLPTLQQ